MDDPAKRDAITEAEFEFYIGIEETFQKIAECETNFKGTTRALTELRVAVHRLFEKESALRRLYVDRQKGKTSNGMPPFQRESGRDAVRSAVVHSGIEIRTQLDRATPEACADDVLVQPDCEPPDSASGNVR